MKSQDRLKAGFEAAFLTLESSLSQDADEVPEAEVSSTTDEFDCVEERDCSQEVGFNLKYIPIDEWSGIAVSPLSKFEDDRWSFVCFPHVDKKSATAIFETVSYGKINLRESSNIHLLLLVKALLFYSLPKFSFNRHGGSYGTVASKKARFVRLIAMLHHFQLYLPSKSGMPRRGLDEISREQVIRYIESHEKLGVRWEIAHALGVWQALSRADLLPICYSIFTEFVDQDLISKYRKAYDDASSGYLPLPLDDYAAIFNYCKTVVEEYGRDILWLARTYCPRAGVDASGSVVLVEGESTASIRGVELFRKYKPVLVNGEPWWSLKIMPRMHERDVGEFISYMEIVRLIAGLFDCAVTLIFATTGMRRSEVRALKVNCISSDPDGHWLTYKVFKTSEGSQGEIRRIPIPDITVRAISVLKELCAESRAYGKHDSLFSTVLRADFFGRVPFSSFTSRCLERVCLKAGIEHRVHSHQFRKSLAMYVIYKDTGNIDIIAHLFAHKSLRMTMKYLLALPSVSAEIRRELLRQNVDILREVVAAAESGAIGGIAGNRIKESIEGSRKFRAILQDDGKESLAQFIDAMLDDGISLLHRSALAICMKIPAVNEISPCNGRNEKSSNRLKPNLWACSPLGCSHAVFTERHVVQLENDIAFHRRQLSHPYATPRQIAFSARKIVESRKRLREVTGGSSDGA